MTNDGNLQQIRVRFSAFTFSRAFDNELFKGSEDPGQKLLSRVHFFGTRPHLCNNSVEKIRDDWKTIETI